MINIIIIVYILHLFVRDTDKNDNSLRLIILQLLNSRH